MKLIVYPTYTSKKYENNSTYIPVPLRNARGDVRSLRMSFNSAGAPWVSPEASQRVLSPEPFLLSLSGPEDDASSVIVERVVETIGASQNGFPLIF
jgi:hypothetical protein